ncbi:transposase, partial [Escherichia coli]|uniref:transposase n=1 Tax=Escherichia coli TaxID=562 RepID=UPI00289D255E
MKDQITYLPDNADRSVAKQKFKITNWPTYNKALINRGSITFWLDDEAIQAWYESATPSSRGRPQRYSDLAITTVLVIKRVFRLTLRAAQGGTVAKLAMRQPFVLFKGLTFQKLCLP